MKISDAVTKLLNEVDRLLPRESGEATALQTLVRDISEIRKRLDEPLRVAIVGMVKAGKSTLFNAILGEKILFTDVLEATHTACWFKYGEERSLTVHFSDDTEKEVPFSELEKWSSWKGRREDGVYIARKWLVIKYPSPFLQVMDLIDTAGLNAATAEEPEDAEDVRNTLDLLKSAEVEAFIYAYERVPQEQDLEILKEYNSSPLNAVGVLTRVDNQLKPDDNPIKFVSSMCERHSGELRGSVYNVLPTAAKMAEGVTCMDGTAFNALKKLAETENETLRKSLISESKFLSSGAEGSAVTAEERKLLIKLFGKNGLYLAAQAAREGLSGEDFRERMYAKSGVDKLRERVAGHFGNHAYLIRLAFVLRRMEKLIGEARRGNRGNEKVVKLCSMVKIKIEEWQNREELLFRELSVLSAYYSGGIKFDSPEMEERFKQITGEYGTNCEARLGYGDNPVRLRDMKLEAANVSQIWLSALNDVGSTTGIQKAADVAVRILNEMRTHLDALSGYDG